MDDTDPSRRRRRGRLNSTIEDTADFEGTVVAGAEKVEYGSTGKGADLVHGCGLAGEEELLNLIERSWSERFEQSEAEGLCGRRVDAIEDDGGACALHGG